MRKMLMVLWLSIIVANAQNTERVKGCGVKPNGKNSDLTVVHDNQFVGVYISPKHYLITYRSVPNYNKTLCEQSKTVASNNFPDQKVTFIGTCSGMHGFFLVEDTKLKHDYFACLPTEALKIRDTIEVIKQSRQNVAVHSCLKKDIAPEKVCFTPSADKVKEKGFPVVEKGTGKPVLHGIGIYEHNKHLGEFVSVFHHVETICETMGKPFCEPLTTTAAPTIAPPPTTVVTTLEPTTAAAPPSPTTKEPLTQVVPITDPSPTIPLTRPTPAGTPAPIQTSQETSRPNTIKKKKKTSKAPEIQGPEALKDVLEECNDKFLCFNDDDFNSAEGHGILMAIGMILVMIL